MVEKRIEEFLNIILFVGLICFLLYGLYAAGNSRSFDNACAESCSPSRSITPIIDMKNQCLCDEGQGKWRYQDAR
jgi:hypothetical protein